MLRSLQKTRSPPAVEPGVGVDELARHAGRCGDHDLEGAADAPLALLRDGDEDLNPDAIEDDDWVPSAPTKTGVRAAHDGEQRHQRQQGGRREALHARLSSTGARAGAAAAAAALTRGAGGAVTARR